MTTVDNVLVLNVDDNEVGRYTKSRLLRMAGYEVIEAASGAQAIELARSRGPDLALLDVKLPDIGGFEVCRQLKSDPRTRLISVLQVSASFVTTDDMVRGLEGGADGYLTTPIETPVLLATIRSLLRARRAEAEMVRTQQMLNDFFENAAMGLQWVARDGVILRANQAQLELVACSAEEYIGRNLADFFEDPQIAETMLTRLAAGETLQGYHTRVRGCDGHIRDVLITANALWENGQFIHARCFLRDITDIRRMNLELNESKTRLDLALDAADQGTWEVDLSTGRIEVSERMARLMGVPPGEELTLEGWTQRVHPDDRTRFSELLRDTSRSDAFNMEYRIVRPNGEICWIDQRGRITLSDSGRPLRGLGLVMDITHRKQAQDRLVQHAVQLEQAKRALEEASQAKDEFLATVSHELRTPLTAIVGWSKLLLLGKAGDSTHALEVIQRSAFSLTQIVEEILDTSRIITGKVALKHELTNVEPLVREALEGVGLAAAAKGIVIDLSIEGSPVPICCDPGRVQQVIWNLLTNAVKFTPAGGKVWIAVSHRESGITIIVRDTGQGIPAEFMPHLFGRFRQADSSTTREHGGLGLGLAISKHLVELHGGTIEAASEGENKGSTFTIILPSAYEAAAPADQVPSIARQSPHASTYSVSAAVDLHGLTIVLVEDDPESCRLTARCLSQNGAVVYQAGSVSEGLALVIEKRPDVVISDISMPDQDGFDLIKGVRSMGGRCAELPCLALTAMARPEDRSRILAAGYDDHLAKPFDVAVLAQKVADLAQAHASAPATPAHILLAEDNPDIAELIKITLESRGYCVSAAEGVMEAASIAEQRPVDLLISDVRLKDGTGWELMSRLRQSSTVQGIAMSGYSGQDFIEESRAAGFSDYLLKPVEESTLLDCVARLLCDRRDSDASRISGPVLQG